MKRKLSLLLTLAMILSPSIAKASNVNENQTQQVNIKQNKNQTIKPYKINSIKSTERDFVKSLAKLKGLSFEKAEEINNQNIENLVNSRMPNLVTRYSTEKQYFHIADKISLSIATEVKYIHNNETGENQIASVGNPYIDLEGAHLENWDGGEFNINVSKSKARISVTGQVYMKINKSIAEGLDLGGLHFDYSTSTDKFYSTDIDTYVMNIYAKYL